MKVIIQSADLKNGLETVGKIFRKQGTPIVDNIVLSADEDGITLFHSNLQSSIKVKVDGEIEQHGKVLISKDAVKLIKKIDGSLTIEGLKDRLSVKGNRKYEAATMDVEDYPEEPEETCIKAFDIKENAFRDVLKLEKLIDAKSVRTSIRNIMINGNEFSATDGLRSGVITIDIVNNVSNTIYIPVESIKELAKLLNAKSDDLVGFEYLGRKNDARFKIIAKDFVYTAKMFSESDFNIASVYPADFKHIAKVDGKAFDNALSFAYEVAKDEKWNAVKLEYGKDDFMKISAESDVQKSEEEIEAEVVTTSLQEKVEEHYNSRNIMDFLKLLACDDVEMKFSNRFHLVFTPFGKNNERYLTMLVRV